MIGGPDDVRRRRTHLRRVRPPIPSACDRRREQEEPAIACDGQESHPACENQNSAGAKTGAAPQTSYARPAPTKRMLRLLTARNAKNEPTTSKPRSTATKAMNEMMVP